MALVTHVVPSIRWFEEIGIEDDPLDSRVIQVFVLWKMS